MAVNESKWLITAAAVPGKSHLDAGIPCQDAWQVATTADGRWLAGAVSDGAGSAARAAEGAAFVTAEVVAALIAETARIDTRGPGVWLKDRVHAILIDVRERLRDMGSDIADFHCTLVGVLIGPTGGFFFHVGDGAALASGALLDGPGAGDRKLQLWDKVILSEPENGEYINETFFVTEDNWDKHLRSTVLSEDLDIIALMSDGAMPLVLQRGRPYVPFINPIISRLLTTPELAQRERLVQGYLAAPETYPLTGDDKTLLLAVNRELQGHVDAISPAPALQEASESPSAGGSPPAEAPVAQSAVGANLQPGRLAPSFVPWGPRGGIAIGGVADRAGAPGRPGVGFTTLIAVVALLVAVVSLALSVANYLNAPRYEAAAPAAVQSPGAVQGRADPEHPAVVSSPKSPAPQAKEETPNLAGPAAKDTSTPTPSPGAEAPVPAPRREEPR